MTIPLFTPPPPTKPPPPPVSLPPPPPPPPPQQAQAPQSLQHIQLLHLNANAQTEVQKPPPAPPPQVSIGDINKHVEESSHNVEESSHNVERTNKQFQDSQISQRFGFEEKSTASEDEDENENDDLQNKIIEPIDNPQKSVRVSSCDTNDISSSLTIETMTLQDRQVDAEEWEVEPTSLEQLQGSNKTPIAKTWARWSPYVTSGVESFIMADEVTHPNRNSTGKEHRKTYIDGKTLEYIATEPEIDVSIAETIDHKRFAGAQTYHGFLIISKQKESSANDGGIPSPPVRRSKEFATGGAGGTLPVQMKSPISVERRYKHFEWLQKNLTHHYGAIAVPHLPLKASNGKYAEDAAALRQKLLERWLKRIAYHPILRSSIFFKLFISETDDRKWKAAHRSLEYDSSEFLLSVQICNDEGTVKLTENEARMEAFKQFVREEAKALRNVESAVNIFAAAAETFRSTFCTLSDSIASLQGIPNGTFDTTTHTGKTEVFCPIPDCEKCVPLTMSVSSLRQGCAMIGETYKSSVHDTHLPFIHSIQEMSGQTPNLSDLVSIYETVAAQYRQVVRHKLHTPEYKFRSDVVACVCLAEVGIWHSYRRREMEQAIGEWAKGMQKTFQLGSSLFDEVTLDTYKGPNAQTKIAATETTSATTAFEKPFTFETRNGVVTPLMEVDEQKNSSEDWDNARASPKPLDFGVVSDILNPPKINVLQSENNM